MLADQSLSPECHQLQQRVNPRWHLYPEHKNNTPLNNPHSPLNNLLISQHITAGNPHNSILTELLTMCSIIVNPRRNAIHPLTTPFTVTVMDLPDRIIRQQLKFVQRTAAPDIVRTR